MAQFFRGKQAGIQRDFSAGLDPGQFAVDTVARYGINSQISAIAYEPVQSLLAVGTSDTQYGSGQIYIFGQGRVSVTFSLPRKASVKILQFCADKVVCVDSKDDFSIYSLITTRIIATYAPPSHITALLTDPALDYALLGLQNGEIISYDMDRQGVAPFKLPNLWISQNPRARILPVVSLAFHPRNIGSLLIGYIEGAVVFSFQQNKPTNFFQYNIPAGAPGGDSDPVSSSRARSPRLIQAIWHPTGTFILTAHEDSSLVIWDPKDGRKILARTIEATNVDIPGGSHGSPDPRAGTFAMKEPLFRIAWCAKENPDDTGILIAGGSPTTVLAKGLNFIELGLTPNYATSPWQLLSDHFEKPKRQHLLPTPPGAEVVDFCLIPRKSPHFAGSQDPIAVIALLASGAITTLSFPSGHPISPTNQLHVSLSFVHPFINRIAMAYVERTQWLGMTENRPRGPPILKGGIQAKNTLKNFTNRNIIQTAHADGTIRAWDAGHGDEIENGASVQIDIARAVGRASEVDITQMAMSGATGELSVGLRTGEVVIFRWGRNEYFGKELPHTEVLSHGLEAIKDRAEPGLKEGLLPLSLLDQQNGPVTALKTSDVGFVAVGFEGGSIAVIDLRGPAVIFNAGIGDLAAKNNKRGTFRKSNSQQTTASEWPTCMSFGIMNLEGEEYSSILLFVGTNLGRLTTLKLLPEAGRGYIVQPAGVVSLDDKVVSISALDADTGFPADASQSVYAALRNGITVNGVLLVVTNSSVRIFKPAAAKGAHKAWDDYSCLTANVVLFGAQGYVLVGLFSDGRVRAFSIPGLKEVGAVRINDTLDQRRLSDAIITDAGDIFGWTGPSEIAALNVWGAGDDLSRSLDKIFNVEALIPPRPTISNMQWLSGTTYITPTDMDKLIGGPDRPPSQRMIEQTRADEQAQRMADRQVQAAGTSSSAATAAPGSSNESYWAYMQRQIQERTENLGITGESMGRLEDNSSGFAEDMSKFVSKQKKKAVMGVIGNKDERIFEHHLKVSKVMEAPSTMDQKADISQHGRKRKVEDNAKDGPRKKKQWRTPKKGQPNSDRSIATINAGDAGIWVTCDMHKEGACTAECRDLFNEYVDVCYAALKDETQSQPTEELEGAVDIEKEISEEISGMKQAKANALFQAIKIDIQCVLFFKTCAPVEPVSFVHKICSDASESAGKKKSRWIKRLTPMTRMGKANEKSLEEVSKIVLGPAFHSDGVTAKKFAIRTTIRNNSAMKRDDVIKQVADAVGSRHKVDLTNYDLLILVDIYRNILGMSVVGSDFDKLKRFNLAELYEPTAKAEKPRE